MADSNVNRPSRSEQSSANAPGAPQASSKPSKIDQSLDEIIASRKGGQISAVQKKKKNEIEAAVDGVVVQKKRAVQALDNAPASGFSGRLVVATENEVERHFKHGRLLDMTDLNPNLAIKPPMSMNAILGEELGINHLISMWKQQNGGHIPPTWVNFTRIRGGSRLQSRIQEPHGEVDDDLELEPELDEDEEQQQPKALTGPAPPVEEKKKKKMKMNSRQRKRARQEREELERQAAHAAASGRVQDSEMGNAPESEGGHGRAGQNPPFQQQFTFRAPASAPSFPPAPVCGNCNKQGHILTRCPGPVDEDGFVSGCVLHNTKQHSCDECYILKTLQIGVHFELLVKCRSGLPPIRSEESNWVRLATRFQDRRLEAYPLTRSFSLKLSEEVIASYDFSEGASVFQLGSDPLTCSFDAMIKNYERLQKTESPSEQVEVEEEQAEEEHPQQAQQQPDSPQWDTPVVNYNYGYNNREINFGPFDLGDYVD
ncbi:hypothetical protein F4815DRAFT_501484 [Daldinia loculata]|nr:hypothetical protein F4815DRAFT_501484 [Daldinia loculata]